MGQNSPYEAQIRELFGRVAWSHKTHEKCADIALIKYQRIKLAQTILSALTTTGLLVTISNELQVQWIPIVSAILSAILFSINLYVKGHDYGKIATQHSETACNLWDIRESYVSLLVDIYNSSITDEEIISKRDSLQKRLGEIYKTSPRTTSSGYNKASKALQEKEELTFSDRELDRLLPTYIRKTNKD